MGKPSVIGRRIGVWVAHCLRRLYTHSNYILLALVLVIIPAISVMKWRYLWVSILAGLNKLAIYVLRFSMDHPHIARGMHVLLNAMPDAVPLLLGMAGLVYIIPNLARRIEKSKLLRWIVAVFCVLISALAIAVNAINREAQEHTENLQQERLGTVEDTNNQILKAILNPYPDVSEPARRKRIETVLRSKYILSQNQIDPEIIAGNKMPPDDWMNMQLKGLGESWRVKNTENVQPPRIVQEAVTEKKATVKFSFYQEDRTGDSKTVTLDPMINGKFTASIVAIVEGDIPAENLQIWIRKCIGCQWVATNPPGFLEADADHYSDRQTLLPEALPNVDLPKWNFEIQAPIYPPYETIPIACYYACKNCRTVDWKKPQILYVTKSFSDMYTLQIPLISTAPEPVH